MSKKQTLVHYTFILTRLDLSKGSSDIEKALENAFSETIFYFPWAVEKVKETAKITDSELSFDLPHNCSNKNKFISKLEKLLKGSFKVLDTQTTTK